MKKGDLEMLKVLIDQYSYTIILGGVRNLWVEEVVESTDLDITKATKAVNDLSISAVFTR